MSWLTVAVCDVCKRQRGEANHWLLYEGYDTLFLTFRKWREDLAQTWGHLCGEECAIRLLHRHLAGDKAAAPTSKPESSTAPEAKELAYEPVCEFCGPGCAGGVVHAQRVANDDRRMGGMA